MDSATEKALENQDAAQNFDAESSFEVISDSDDPVSSESDHSAPAQPVDETPSPALMPDLGNEASSSIIVLAGSGSAGKNVLPATAELVAETPGCLPAPAPTPDTETDYSASSSLVLLSESGSTGKKVQSAPFELVAETTAPASTPHPGTANADSSSLAVLAGSGSADDNFQDENSMVIGQSYGEDRDRDQKRTEGFSAFYSFEREREINHLISKVDENLDPFVDLDLQPRLYLSMPNLRNLSDDDDTDCSIDIIDEQHEVNLNNVIF